ncbi:MAG: hypothetical protein J1E34_05265 [Oscillospiraceae bacterium]|nr:hypothetical protein [Oscillospiraceae bacterium]
MIELKNNKIIYWTYAALWVLLSGVFIFEIPKIVFWSPTVLFSVFLVYYSVNKKPLKMPAPAALLLVFGIFFVLFTYTPTQTLYYQSYIFLHMLFMYIMGYNFFPNDEPKNKRFDVLKKYIFIVSLLFIAYVALTYINFLRDPAAAPGERKDWSVWYPGLVKKTATGFCASMFFAVAWGSYSIFFSKEKYKKIIGAVLVIICFVFNIITETRLLVFFAPFLLAAEFIAWMMIRKKKIRLGIILIGGVFLAAVGSLLCYFLFKDVLQEKFSDSVFSRFIELGLRSTRWKYAMNVIKDFSITYLGGGVHSFEVGVPHNFWLYIYDFGGIIPFAAYSAFSVMTVVSYIRFLRNKEICADLKIFLTTVFVAVLVELMLEDLLYGLPSFVLIAHFIFGVISGFDIYRPNKISKE